MPGKIRPVLILIAAGLYVFFQLFTPVTRLHGNDFKHLYLGAKIIRQGNNPYHEERIFYEARRSGFRTVLPYVYLPFTGLMLVPLTLFRFSTASLIWFVINHAFLIFGLYLLVMDYSGRRRLDFLFLWIAYLALFYPLTRNLTAGQLNVVLFLCFVLVWKFHEKKIPAAVGAVTAFAALFKLSPGILFLYFLWKRQWKNFFWSCGFAAVFMIFSVLIAGVGMHLDFMEVLGKMSYGHSTWEQYGQDFYRDPFNQSFNSLFHHLFTTNPYSKPWLKLNPETANGITTLVSLFLLGLVMFFTRPGKKGREHLDEKAHFSLFILLSLFIPSLCWDHYLVQALFPAVVAADLIRRSGRKIHCVIFSAALLVMAMPYNFHSELFKRGPGILLMSLKLWGMAAIFILIILLMKQSPEKKAEKNVGA